MMATSTITPGVLVLLKEIESGSQFFKQGASLRVTGILHAYNEDTAVAVIADENISFKINTAHLRDLSFRIGSCYQFIGELHILPEDVAIMQARAGRIVDGLDLNLYHQSLQLRRRKVSSLYVACHAQDESIEGEVEGMLWK